MNQNERKRYLIRELLNENAAYHLIDIPENDEKQRQILRGLMNIRRPEKISKEFLAVQDVISNI